MIIADLGTVSHGTLREQDLTREFVSFLDSPAGSWVLYAVRSDDND